MLTTQWVVVQVDLSQNRLCGLDLRQGGTYNADGIKAIAEAITVSPSITVVDLRYNGLDTKSATILANIAKEKKISLCGIKPEQTEADFRPSKNGFKKMKSADAILLSADLTVRPSVTSVRAFRNS